MENLFYTPNGRNPIGALHFPFPQVPLNECSLHNITPVILHSMCCVEFLVIQQKSLVYCELYKCCLQMTVVYKKSSNIHLLWLLLQCYLNPS